MATDYWALRSIESLMPLNELAHCMDFDASYVTIVADRLETLGLVSSRHHREECLEMWDYHWKKVISRLESRLAKTESRGL